ncbi:hypothetical protein Ddc_09459 [Ditylenchus destructor]|nr:hypothetical protein Ddc_09459 [Ditylenchus destructor]
MEETTALTEENRKPKLHSKDSIAFLSDPFNRPELTHTLRGRELIIFIVGYVIAVTIIVIMFEKVMPVLYIFQSRPQIPARFASNPLYSRHNATISISKKPG